MLNLHALNEGSDIYLGHSAEFGLLCYLRDGYWHPSFGFCWTFLPVGNSCTSPALPPQLSFVETFHLEQFCEAGFLSFCCSSLSLVLKSPHFAVTARRTHLYRILLQDKLQWSSTSVLAFTEVRSPHSYFLWQDTPLMLVRESLVLLVISHYIQHLLLLVDCWDGPNDEPVIYHGRTLTSKILFKDVIETINEYAFEMSE